MTTTRLILAGAILCSSFSFGQNITLDSYLSENPSIDAKVDSILNTMSSSDIVAQLLMPAIGRLGENEDSIRSFINDGLIGGLLMLNGTKSQFTNWISEFNGHNKEMGRIPFLYSADAEPSLVNSKIKNSHPVPKANAVTSVEEAESVARTISSDLNEIGINYNFAPVVDMSSNKTVGYRGFGANPGNIIPFSNAFIRETQKNNIIATAKHFPGHGLVSGDTHASLQVINGEMKEVKNYIPLIEDGVLSIMIAHIAVRNNPMYDTQGLPSTSSENIVTRLLRDSLGFKGLIVTDALNMGGIANIKDANVRSVSAGCDILLMPKNLRAAHKEILTTYTKDEEFRKRVQQAASRIIRMKYCLGLIP